MKEQVLRVGATMHLDRLWTVARGASSVLFTSKQAQHAVDCWALMNFASIDDWRKAGAPDPETQHLKHFIRSITKGRTMATKRAGCSCYENADQDEPLFVLRAQDVTAPRTVAQWILENIEHAPREKLHEALECAIAMRSWPKRKQAD